MTPLIQHHRAQRIGAHLGEETMYKNLLKKPWVSQATLNAKKEDDPSLSMRVKSGRFIVGRSFTWASTPQGWDYWHILSIEN